MAVLVETELWKKSLGASCDGEDAESSRQALISALRVMEERASTLAGEIARDLPEFPPHDASHSTAVWSMADRIAGTNLTLNPVEAFVLGGAVLLHDLGMAAAAYVDGPEELTKEPRWSDTVASVLRQETGVKPTPEEVTNPDVEVATAVRRRILRELHAEHAERLVTARWRDKKKNEYALLEDPDLRETLGGLIGKVAHSHWMPVGHLGETLQHDLGAPPKAPSQWTVRPLILACLLRLADGSHLDGSRAPRFLRLLRSPEGEAAKHWDFQEHLAQPLQREDRFVFNGTSFDPGEAEAWWLCADTLATLDREFRGVDSLLADRGLPRFAVRGVVGADDVGILAKHIPTDGWTPIDAKVRVSNVVRLVERLGGRELYGSKPEVPLRELIQNGMDAVRARRVVDDLTEEWGRVSIAVTTESEDRCWLEVSDTGLGMSPEVLTNHLLDFGTSFWESERVVEEFPGLLSSSFEPVGKFGIGFFSVFMWGDDVDVISQRYDAARMDTYVLEFRGGVAKRPLLRRASPDERLQEPGTKVRVLLGAERIWRLGLEPEQVDGEALARLCAWMAPASDVDINAEASSISITAVRANDWMEMPLDQLGERIDHSPLRSAGETYPPSVADETGGDEIEAELPAEVVEQQEQEETAREQVVSGIRETARFLHDEEGRVVGRLAVGSARGVGGAKVIGGLRASALSGVTGVVQAKPLTASRNAGVPLVTHESLTKWATEQAELRKGAPAGEALRFADVIWTCGGDTKDLPIASSSEGNLSFGEVEEWVDGRDEIKVVQDAAFWNAEHDGGAIEMAEDVLAVAKASSSLLLGQWSRGREDAEFHYALLGALAKAVGAAWGMPAKDLLEADYNWTRAVVGYREGAAVKMEAAIWRRET